MDVPLQDDQQFDVTASPVSSQFLSQDTTGMNKNLSQTL